MGADVSKAERKKLCGKVIKLPRNTLHSGWQQLAQEFLSSTPQGTTVKCKDKKILEVCLKVFSEQQEKGTHTDMVLILSVFQRLVMAKGIYAMLPRYPVAPFIRATASKDLKVVQHALLLLKLILESSLESQQKVEATLKDAFFQAQGYETLAKLLQKYAQRPKAADVVMAGLGILYSCLVTRQATTDPITLVKVVSLFQETCQDTLFQLTHSENSDLRLFSSAIVKAFCLHLPSAQVKSLQESALQYGIILWQFLWAVLEEKTQASQINISRDLVHLLSDGNDAAMQTIGRMVPGPLFTILLTKPDDDEANRKLTRNVSMRLPKPKNVVSGTYSWAAFWKAMDSTENSCTLRWNDDTRGELRSKLRIETDTLETKRRGQTAAWECESFEIQYDTLFPFLFVGGYYLDLLIPALSSDSSVKIAQPAAFLSLLYNQAVVEDDPKRKLLVLQCTTTIFDKLLAQDETWEFPYMQYLVWLLKREHYHTVWRQQVLILLKSLLVKRVNQDNFITFDGLPVLLYHLNLCHLPDKDPAQLERRLHPQSLAKLCLLLLDTLLDRPLACKRLAAPQTFQYITQALLIDSFEVVDLTTKLLIRLQESRTELTPHLYTTGVFSFLLAALDRGCTPRIIRFLRLYHKAQDGAALPEDQKTVSQQKSYLVYFMPRSIIALLDEEDDESFSSLLQSKCVRPNVLWGEQHLQLLTQTVNKQLDEFREALKLDPTLQYQWARPTAVVYPDLEEEIMVDDVYLSYFNSDPECVIPQPTTFIANLIRLMEGEHSDTYTVTVVRSQTQFIKRFPRDPTVLEYPGFSRLLDILKRDQDSPSAAMLASVTVFLLSKLVAMKKSNNLAAAIKAGIVPAIGDLLHRILIQQEAASVGVLGSIAQLVNRLADHPDATLLISQHPTLLPSIVSLLKPSHFLLAQALAFSVVECISKMAQSRPLCLRIIECGAILYLLQVLLPKTADQAEEVNTRPETPVSAKKKAKEKKSGKKKEKQASKEKHGSVSEAEETSPQFDNVLGAVVHALVTLATNTTAIQPLLTQIFTPTLYEMLMKQSPSDVYPLLHTTHESPTLIWNKAMREELHEFLDMEISKMEGGKRWVYRNLTFNYNSLAKEFLLSGIYVRAYAEMADPSSFKLEDPQDFLVSLLDGIDERVENIKIQSAPDLIEELVQLIKAVYNVVVAGDNSSSLITLLASMSQTAALFTLLHYKDPQAPASPNPTLHPVLRVLEVLSQSSTCSPLLLRHLPSLHWLLNSCSNSPLLQALVFSILCNIAQQSPGGAKQIRDNGIIISTLAIFAGSPNQGTRLKAAELVGALCMDKENGSEIQQLLLSFFCPHFEAALRAAFDDPHALLELYDADNETPFIFWNNETRKDLVNMLIKELNPIIMALTAHNAACSSYSSPPSPYQWDHANFTSRYQRPALQKEQRVGGYYVRFFNGDAGRFIKSMDVDPFFEALVERIEAPYAEGEAPILTAVWEAIENVLLLRSSIKTHPRTPQLLPLALSLLNSSSLPPSVTGKILDVLLLLARKKELIKLIKQTTLLAKVLQYGHSHPKKREGILLFLSEYAEADSRNVLLIRAAGGIIFLLDIIFTPKPKKHRKEAISVLLAMALDKKVGAMIGESLSPFLTQKIIQDLTSVRRADKLLALFDGNHSSQEREWNGYSRAVLGEFLANEATRLAVFEGEWDGSDRWDAGRVDAVHATLKWK